MKYLDLTGLGEVWANIKSYISSKIPTKTSQLQNDSNYATTKQLPRKTSQLTNDSDFTTNAKLATKQDTISDLATIRSGASKGATAVQPSELSNYATKSELSSKANDSDVVHKSGGETITSTKTIQTSTGHFNWRVPSWEMGTKPETDQSNANMWVYDKNAYMFYTQVWNRADGSVLHRTGVRNKFKGGVLDPTGNFISTSFDVVVDKNANTYIRWDSGKVNNSIFPLTNNTFDLGSPSLKWKDVYATTFNGNLVGNANTATKATNNASGNELSNDIIKGLSVSGKVITYTKLDGTTGTITTQDTNTDTKVTNTLGNTTKAYITGTTSAKTNTGTQIFDSGVYLTTTPGQLHADIDFPITEAQVNEILGIS